MCEGAGLWSGALFYLSLGYAIYLYVDPERRKTVHEQYYNLWQPIRQHPPLCFKESPHISGQDTIIYMGGLYAGGVLGLSKTLRSISPQEIRRLFIVTVGLSDPSKPETTENVHKSLQKQL